MPHPLRGLGMAALVAFGAAAQDEEKPLTAVEQEAQLKKRVGAGLLLASTVSSFCSSAYAMHDVLVYSDVEGFDDERLMSPFPKTYQPTWAEVFETIARQTRTSWSYSEKRAGWLFVKGAMALPYTVDVAKGWEREDRGLYVFHKPEDLPVGLDIWLLGTYSFDKDAAPELLKIRDAWALQFLAQIAPALKIEDMKKVDVDGAEALHVETPAPKEGVTWRQWVFAREGRLYAIVSALDDGHDAELKDVRAMVKSFKFVKAAKK